MAQVPIGVAMLIAAGVTAAGTVAASALAPKPPKAPAAPVQLPTRINAASQALNADSEFRRRQGAAATMITGPGGAEAPSPGAKALLGQ